jgi:hypothetical protein
LPGIVVVVDLRGAPDGQLLERVRAIADEWFGTDWPVFHISRSCAELVELARDERFLRKLAPQVRDGFFFANVERLQARDQVVSSSTST